MKLPSLKAVLLTATFLVAANCRPAHAEERASARGAQARPIYAQSLVDRTVRQHPELLDVILHITPPGATENLAVAAHTEKERGQRSGEDDLGVMKTGKPLVEVQHDGRRVGVLLPLNDRKGTRIGAVGLMFPFHQGDVEDEALQKAKIICAHLERQILSKAALFAEL